MEAGGLNPAPMRRGSYDDAAVSLRPQNFRHLAQRRRSAPSLVLGKTLGVSWPPIREEWSWVSADQSPFVLGLTAENGPLLLEQTLQVTEDAKTRERHLFLFRDVLVFAKLKSPCSFRLKLRLKLEEVWLFGLDPEPDEESPTELLLTWDLRLCLLTFSSPRQQKLCFETVHRSICEARARAGADSAPPDGLMKVLTGNIAVKSLSGGGMEEFIELPINGTSGLSKLQSTGVTAGDKLSENRWRGVVRRLKNGSSFIYRNKVLFGKPLSKVCGDDGSLPKPIMEVLALLRRRAPSTEGAFRKSCNNKKMQEVREQLDAGAEVALDEQPVTLLVGLLKSFLKELPHSLLDSQMYDMWMKAFSLEQQQRLDQLKRVLEKLPRPNVVLLQHLLCVLVHIQEQSESNRMSSANLGVCIGPTLLWLPDAPLDQQPERMKEVADLTQFLIEHWEIVGDNIPNLLDTDEDSVSSQHHDSAYDSTDPDGDLERSSDTSDAPRTSSSQPDMLSLAPQSSPLPPKPSFTRRCSEPILCLSTGAPTVRSRDDFSISARSSSYFSTQLLTKETSDDSILQRSRGLLFPQSNTNFSVGSRVRECSCSSLDSNASNQSDGSVFTSSPTGSPTCTRKANQEQTDERKHARLLAKAKSINRISVKKKSELLANGNNVYARIQEDQDCENTAHKPRPHSAIDVFRHFDHRIPCEPPSYQQAVQNVGLPPAYGAMTVQDAIQLDRRSRPSSVNYDWPVTATVPDLGTGERLERSPEKVERRPRAMSESVPLGRTSEALLRRCSQPLFEEFSYAKESYV